MKMIFHQLRYVNYLLLVGLSLALITASSCKKAGKIHHRIVYTTDKNVFRKALGPADTAYKGLGNYVTSITPYSFKAKMNIMAYQDFWKSEHMISYIDGHDNDPRFEIALYADFTGNAVIQPEPILYSMDMWNGVFKQKTVTMNYFIFVPYYIDVDFVLPAPYKAVKPAMLDIEFDQTLNATVCKTKETNLIRFAFTQYPKLPGGYVFGNTDSTFIYNIEGLSVENSEDRPFGGPNYTQPIIRSNHFTPTQITMPDGGESIELVSTLSYDTEGIIQVYAGNDNIAYTQDDIFVYAPRYWERLKVKLESK